MIGNHILEKRHLLDLLKTALSDGLICGLRSYQQKRRVVPIGGFYGGDKVCDPRSILGNHHAHFTAGARVTIRHHPTGAFMGAVPKHNPSLGEKIRNWHKGGSDNSKSMFNSMHLQRFDKGFFGRHFHG